MQHGTVQKFPNGLTCVPARESWRSKIESALAQQARIEELGFLPAFDATMLEQAEIWGRVAAESRAFLDTLTSDSEDNLEPKKAHNMPTTKNNKKKKKKKKKASRINPSDQLIRPAYPMHRNDTYGALGQ